MTPQMVMSLDVKSALSLLQGQRILLMQISTNGHPVLAATEIVSGFAFAMPIWADFVEGS